MTDPVVDTLAELFPSLTVEAHGKLSPSGSAGDFHAGGLAVTPAFIPVLADPRVERMIRLAILSSPAVILVGPPGTGKSSLLRQIVEQIRMDSGSYGFEEAVKEPVWVTPNESWTAQDLVGGETFSQGELVFRPGVVMSAIQTNQWVILDEANRGDMDRIFGNLLTWLAGQEVTVGRISSFLDSSEVKLGWSGEAASKVENSAALDDISWTGAPVRYLAGNEWRLLGTYNALDANRVFRFGQALGRRFVRVPIPPLEAKQFAQILETLPLTLSSETKQKIQQLYEAHLADPATALGPALFLRMADYISAGDSTGAEPLGNASLETDDSEVDAVAAELVSEAYLVNIGTSLADLADDIEQLGQRVTESGALSEADWNWIISMTRVLA